MRTLKIKAPTAELQIPPKVWIPMLVALLGTILFLYFRFKLKKKRELAAAAAAIQDTKEELAEETAPENSEEKLEEKSEKTVIEEETIEDIAAEVEDFTQTALRQNVHLPALSFNNEWEVIPLLPTGEHPIRYRIFNQMGQASVEVYVEKAEKITWQIKAKNMPDVSVPLQDATQLRAVIASYLQQISPIRANEKSFS
jgi:hypothetical protein